MNHEDLIVSPQKKTYNGQYKKTGNHTVLSVHCSLVISGGWLLSHKASLAVNGGFVEATSPFCVPLRDD